MEESKVKVSNIVPQIKKIKIEETRFFVDGKEIIYKN